MLKPTFPPLRIIREGEPVCPTCGRGFEQHQTLTLEHRFERVSRLAKLLHLRPRVIHAAA